MFVANSQAGKLSERDFDREMFRVRKLIETEAELSPHLKDLFVCSLSNQVLTYPSASVSCVCVCVLPCTYACVLFAPSLFRRVLLLACYSYVHVC